MNAIVAQSSHKKGELSSASDVGTLLAMPLQIPAGRISFTGEQRVSTGLHLRRIEDELRLAAFLRYGVVGGDRDLSKRLAVGRDAIAEHSVVCAVGERHQACRRRQSNDDQPL